MEAGELAVDRVDVGLVRKLVRTMDASGSEVRHVYGGLARFCGWMVEEGLIGANPCDALPRRQRPKPGKSRAHVPSLAELGPVGRRRGRADMRDSSASCCSYRFDATKARGCVWSEVDLDRPRILIAAERMKNGEAHELPLAKPALAILAARKGGNAKPDALIFPSSEGKPYNGWNRLLTRIRKALAQDDAGAIIVSAFTTSGARLRRSRRAVRRKSSRPDARASSRVSFRLGRRLPEGEAPQ